MVIIIMESMAASKMKRNGNELNLTPFLDSLALSSYYFDSIYTAGIHTFNGVFSTLFSYPAIFRQQPMRKADIEIQRYLQYPEKAGLFYHLYHHTRRAIRQCAGIPQYQRFRPDHHRG
ncbi:MAG: sulfatase-like hydrolase/transferase [Bacteroidales bacterium]|nr:sulfatase-like hydrolase/transferase [Bacteroidales bacterium]